MENSRNKEIVGFTAGNFDLLHQGTSIPLRGETAFK